MSRKKLLILSSITIIVIAIILVSVMYITKTRDDEVETISKEFYENGWDKDIVAMVKEEIPVPTGFEYVTGTKDEGLIIKNTQTEKQYMWIPAKELSELNDVSGYFNESYSEYNLVDEETLKSVNQYGGFYVELADNSKELYENLKNMDEENYNLQSKNLKSEYNNSISVDSDIIKKGELATILTWRPELISSIGLTSMKLGLSVSTSKNYSEVSEDWEDIVSDVIDGVPIPKGFSYVEGNKDYGLLIQDNKNSKLQFVWVPVGSKYNVSNIKNAREELIEYAEDNDLLDSIVDEWKDCSETLPTQLTESINEYGGFYMSVAELGYDDNGKGYNKFRGMDLSKGGPYANIGDYYRYVNEENYKENYPEVLAKQKQGLSYNKAISISKNLYASNSAVESHLTYGAEWDATILWLANYNIFPSDSIQNTRTAHVMLKDSSEIGKYKDRVHRENSDKTGNMWNETMFNRLWGLAGNLLELTQEKCNGQIVLRGGSWANTGADAPVTSRSFMSQSEVDNSTESTIGFRTCLYLKTDGNYNNDRYDEECDCRYCDCDYCDTGDCDCKYCDCLDYYDEDYYDEECDCRYCDCDYCDTGDCDCKYCDCSDYHDQNDDNTEANAPVLTEGMIPVRHNGTNWVVVDEDSSNWYNYDNKQWANVMLSDGKYESDDVKEGETIKDSDLGSMLVWIPRFAYSIEDSYHSKTNGDVEIKFLKDTSNRDKSGNTYETDYDEDDVNDETDMIVHPAFTSDGNKEGIWVGKFESSKASNKISILPNKTAWTSITYSSASSTASNMKSQSTYGFKSNEVKTNIMKNSEWGAVAYLAISEYGKGSEVYVNNNSSMKTGMSAGSTSASSSSSTTNSYNTIKGKGASTTGNIYGIYDLSGGVWEYVDSEDYNLSGTASNNYNKSAEIKGGAIYETSKTYTGNNSWFSDASVYPTINNKLIRGGSYKDGSSAGLFAFNGTSSNSNKNVGFRVVVTVK